MGKLLKLNISNDRAGDVVIHNGEAIPVIKYKHMPPIIVVPWGEICGADDAFSFYRGVAVLWICDRFDTRVLTLIDEMNSSDRLDLLLVEYWKGVVCFLWKGDIPDQYAEGLVLNIHEGEHMLDSWYIETSRSLSDR